MRLARKLGLGVAALAMASFIPAAAHAATLNFTHVVGGTNTYYELFVQENCTNDCTVRLDIELGGAFDGKYIDAIQFKINGSTPTAVDLTSTNAGNASQWDVLFASLNANQCGGGDSHSVCAEFNLDNLGFGPLSGGSTLTWIFSVDWTQALVLGQNLFTGNVRAAYNNANGSNFTIFSPGGGGFGGDGGGGGGIVVPEPATLALFGLGMVAAGYRARRRLV